MALKNGMRPVHPGEILKEDFLKPSGLSVNALAKALHVPTPRINDIVLKRRGISADTAMRLGVQKELSAIDRSHDLHKHRNPSPVITPAAEPAGRAPDGRAFEA